MTKGQVTVGWIVTRLATIVLLIAFEQSRGVIGDINHFSRGLAHVPLHGLAHTLVEYPLPAVGLVAIPWMLALASTDVYPLTFLLSTLAVDAAFTVVLVRRTRPGAGGGVLMWLAAVPLLGGVVLMRFDLVVGVLVAVALMVVSERPRLASVAVGLATTIKLWPVILLPSLAAAVRRRRDAVVPFLLVGVVAAGVSLLLAGWGRLVSPLTYQADRGLQIESLAATPAMGGFLVRPGSWRVHYSAFKAYEVTGPGVRALLGVTTALTVAFLVLLVVLWWRALRRSAPVSPQGLLWLCLASVTGFLVSSKVFSPQYLLWLLPLAAAGLTFTSGRAVRVWSVLLLVVAAITHVVYPVAYRGLTHHEELSYLAVPLLVVRNLLVVALLVLAVVQAWRATAALPAASVVE